MAITLHTATPSDAGDIARLLRASWAATYGSFLTPDELSAVAREWHHPDRLRRQISNPRVGFLLARIRYRCSGRSRDRQAVRRWGDRFRAPPLRSSRVPGSRNRFTAPQSCPRGLPQRGANRASGCGGKPLGSVLLDEARLSGLRSR